MYVKLVALSELAKLDVIPLLTGNDTIWVIYRSGQQQKWGFELSDKTVYYKPVGWATPFNFTEKAL